MSNPSEELKRIVEELEVSTQSPEVVRTSVAAALKKWQTELEHLQEVSSAVWRSLIAVGNKLEIDPEKLKEPSSAVSDLFEAHIEATKQREKRLRDALARIRQSDTSTAGVKGVYAEIADDALKDKVSGEQ